MYTRMCVHGRVHVYVDNRAGNIDKGHKRAEIKLLWSGSNEISCVSATRAAVTITTKERRQS